MHGIKNTSMYRFQSVTNIRKCPGHDNRHRVIQIRFLHLIGNIRCCNLTYVYS